jgi:hypothetical protein
VAVPKESAIFIVLSKTCPKEGHSNLLVYSVSFTGTYARQFSVTVTTYLR